MITVTSPRASTTFIPETAVGESAPHLARRWVGYRQEDRSVSRGIETQDLLRRIADVAREAGQDNWDGDGARPVEEGTIEWASVFAACLPTNLPLPDVSADVDGDISFEWYCSPRRVVTVSVRRDGVLNWASLIGRARLHSNETLRAGLPPELVQHVHRVGEP